MLKKCISLFLGLVLLFGAGSSSVLAMGSTQSTQGGTENTQDVCEKTNHKGGTFNLDCAEDAVIQKLRKDPGEPRVMQNVGPNAEYDLRAWSFNALSQLAEAFNRLLSDAKSDREISIARQEAIEKVKRIFGIPFGSAQAIVDGIAQDLKIDKVAKVAMQDKAKKKISGDARFISSWSVAGAGAAALVVGTVMFVFNPPAGAAVVAAGVKAATLAALAKTGVVSAAAAVGGTTAGLFSSVKTISDRAKEAEVSEFAISNGISAIKQILACIEQDCWKGRDTVYIEFYSDPPKRHSTVGFRKLNIPNTTDYIQHAKSFEILKAKLSEILEKNK